MGGLMSKSNRPFYIPTDDFSAEFLFFSSQPRMVDKPSPRVTADDLKKKDAKVNNEVLPVGLPIVVYEKEIYTPRNSKS